MFEMNSPGRVVLALGSFTTELGRLTPGHGLPHPNHLGGSVEEEKIITYFLLSKGSMLWDNKSYLWLLWSLIFCVCVCSNVVHNRGKRQNNINWKLDSTKQRWKKWPLNLLLILSVPRLPNYTGILCASMILRLSWQVMFRIALLDVFQNVFFCRPVWLSCLSTLPNSKRLWVPFLVREYTEVEGLVPSWGRIWKATYQCFSLYLLLSLPLSKINKFILVRIENKKFSFYLIFYFPCFACNINGYFFFLLQKFLTIFWVFLQYKACFFYDIFQMKNLHRLKHVNGELKFISVKIILKKTRGMFFLNITKC